MTTNTAERSADDLHARATRKAMLRLIPMLCGIYFLSFIDRTNVALAKAHLAADLGISAAAYGWAPEFSSWATRCWKCPATSSRIASGRAAGSRALPSPGEHCRLA